MRFVFILIVGALVGVPPAFAGHAKDLDAQQISALAVKAQQATPKDQCYLYAQLVSAMTDQAGEQLSNGKTSDVVASLQAIQKYTSRIRQVLTDKSKKLKDAQILLRHTAFRLRELMKGGAVEQQPDFQMTLQQVNQVQSQMMLAVFQK